MTPPEPVDQGAGGAPWNDFTTRDGIRRVVAVAHDGSVWRAPMCPFCGQVMMTHRSRFDIAGMPGYMCDVHGNADMIFVDIWEPSRGADPFIEVTALSVDRYDGDTVYVGGNPS